MEALDGYPQCAGLLVGTVTTVDAEEGITISLMAIKGQQEWWEWHPRTANPSVN